MQNEESQCHIARGEFCAAYSSESVQRRQERGIGCDSDIALTLLSSANKALTK